MFHPSRPLGLRQDGVVAPDRGFESPDAGTVSIGDAVVADAASGTMVPPNERGLGMVFQDYAVWPHMDVADNVAYPRSWPECRARRCAAAPWRRWGWWALAVWKAACRPNCRAANSSASRSPAPWCPSPACCCWMSRWNNLDANLREEMRFEIKALQQKLGVTVFYVTHDQEIALGFPTGWR
jgi:iron(III) transport system ATP-binding protein